MPSFSKIGIYGQRHSSAASAECGLGSGITKQNDFYIVSLKSTPARQIGGAVIPDGEMGYPGVIPDLAPNPLSGDVPQLLEILDDGAGGSSASVAIGITWAPNTMLVAPAACATRTQFNSFAPVVAPANRQRVIACVQNSRQALDRRDRRGAFLFTIESRIED